MLFRLPRPTQVKKLPKSENCRSTACEIPLERESSNFRLNKKVPMQKVTTTITILILGALLNNLEGQSSAASKTSVAAPKPDAAKAELAQTDAIDLTAQYQAALSKKRDGQFPLYIAKDGTKVLLPVKGGKPGDMFVVDKDGKPVSSSRSKKKLRDPEAWLCWGPHHTKPCVMIKVPPQ
jgi:hypothetical protein